MSGRVPTALLGAAAGCLVADIYYAQPIVKTIGAGFGLSTASASLVVTVTQLAYGAGLLFLAPLGDVVENRRLIVATTFAAALAMALAALAPSSALFFAACVLIGASAVAVQMIVPLAAHLAPPERRGAAVGSVMSGLLLGIVLARPVASVITYVAGWRWVYGTGALAAVLLAGLLARGLAPRAANAPLTYGELVRSLWPIFRTTPVLRRRAFYQAMLFGAFSLFWTAAPLALQAPPFDCSQLTIAFFTFAGAAGAFAAPIAGRLADRGHTRVGTAVAISLVALAFGIAWLGRNGSLAEFIVAGIVLDLGVQANLVFGQRLIYALDAERRSRLNSLYMATFFTGGAAGSALAGVLLASGGLPATCLVGAGAACAALAALASDREPSVNVSTRVEAERL